jgi:hypothetical protein
MAPCSYRARKKNADGGEGGGTGERIARQKKLPPWISWLVRKMTCLRPHCWRLMFSLGLKFHKPIAKINYRALIYFSLFEMLLVLLASISYIEGVI